MKHLKTSLIFFIISIMLLGCGISEEVRVASKNLVEAQKSSLNSHKDFHEKVIASLNMFLDNEIARSEKTFATSIESYNKAMLEEIESIYSNTSLTEVQKKVNEEKARQQIAAYIDKAKKNYEKRSRLLNEAKDKLKSASNSLLNAEKAKLNVVESLNNYLQAKRPIEKLLEMVNIDLSKYSGYVDDANNAISQAEDLIGKLKK